MVIVLRDGTSIESSITIVAVSSTILLLCIIACLAAGVETAMILSAVPVFEIVK